MKTYGAGASGGQTPNCPGVLLALLLLYLLLLLLLSSALVAPEFLFTRVVVPPGVGPNVLGKYPC